MKALFELLQPIAEHLVVVPAPGVPGDAAVTGPFVRAMVGQVVDSDRNDRSTPRKDESGISSFLRRPFHPCHCAVEAAGEPVGQPGEEPVLEGRGRGVDAGDAHGVESQRAGFAHDCL